MGFVPEINYLVSCVLYLVMGKNTQNQIFLFHLLISLTKPTFSFGKNYGSTRHLCEKNEPTFDCF